MGQITTRARAGPRADADREWPASFPMSTATVGRGGRACGTAVAWAGERRLRGPANANLVNTVNVIVRHVDRRNMFLAKQFQEQAASRHYSCWGADTPRFTIEAVEGNGSSV
jgi:hypothetical protein